MPKGPFNGAAPDLYVRPYIQSVRNRVLAAGHYVPEQPLAKSDGGVAMHLVLMSKCLAADKPHYIYVVA